ncbi:hypothetical protein SMICM17S_05673 [Streptomyces microflavus]
MRLVPRGDLAEDLAELVQVQAERALRRGQRQLRVGGRNRVARLAQDRLDPGVRVLEVDRRVAVERHHLVEVELVVPYGGGRQVRVLHGPDADVPAVLHDLVLGEPDLLGLLPDDSRGPGDRLVEEVLQPHGLALTGLERLAVLAQDRAERELHGLHVLVEPARPAGRLEDHLEVQRLPGVHHVQQGVGLEVLHPVADRGEVGGRVAVTAVRLLHDERDLVAVRTQHIVEEDAQRTLGADGDARLLQDPAGLLQHVVVAGLTDDVGVADLHVELVEDGVEVDLRLVDEALPQLQRLGVPGLEGHHPVPRARLELLVGVEQRTRRLVDPVQRRHRRLAVRRVTLVLQGARVLDQILDEHAELGAPVADVVAPDHALAGELQDPDHRVTDDRRPQVADVHLLGHVRLGVVDDRGPGRRVHRHAEAALGVGGPGGQRLDDRPVRERDVEEAGAGDLDVLDQLTRREGGGDLACQLPGVALELLGERQDAVGLEVGPVASAQQRVRGAGIRQSCRQGVRQLLLERGSEGRDRGHGWLPFP